MRAELRLALLLTRGSDRREWWRVTLTTVGAVMATGIGLVVAVLVAMDGHHSVPVGSGLLDEPGTRDGVITALMLLLNDASARLAGHTIVYDVRFADRKEEFDFELERFRSFERLVPLALLEFRPSAEARVLVDRFYSDLDPVVARDFERLLHGVLANGSGIGTSPSWQLNGPWSFPPLVFNGIATLGTKYSAFTSMGMLSAPAASYGSTLSVASMPVAPVEPASDGPGVGIVLLP